MRIGVPKEIKNHEYRVGMTPSGARQLSTRGHEILVEAGAGVSAGFPDDDYRAAGARIVSAAADAWDADLVVKVKEPQSAELGYIRRDLVLFTYLHLVTCPEVVDAMTKSGAVGIAYETVTDAHGDLPLLVPMSEVAGRLSVQVGAWALMLPQGGSGVLLPGVAGVPPCKVTILGAGTVGTHAAWTAVGFGADVTIMDVNVRRLRQIEEIFGARLKTCYSEPDAIATHVAASDLLIGAVLVRGKHAPKLVTREMLRSMRPGSVFVDVGIDQGGCAETSRPTTHADPLYVEEGVLHYCVANMPGAVARTSTHALTQATLPYAIEIATHGWREALRRDPGLCQGLQVWNGGITYRPLAEDLGVPSLPPEQALT
ncbi:MAG: alanine dehydrogenase [Betaproteobacteria bacterium]|nr:alanine dehydrogenase [Betaproteobacteria bacterium]